MKFKKTKVGWPIKVTVGWELVLTPQRNAQGRNCRCDGRDITWDSAQGTRGGRRCSCRSDCAV